MALPSAKAMLKSLPREFQKYVLDSDGERHLCAITASAVNASMAFFGQTFADGDALYIAKPFEAPHGGRLTIIDGEEEYNRRYTSVKENPSFIVYTLGERTS